MTTLSKEETEFLASKIFPELATHARSLDVILRKWGLHVESVEAGYELDTNSFTGGMSYRGILESIWVSGPLSLREKIFERLNELDNRYRAATWEVSIPVDGPDASRSEWWRYRIPKKAGSEFERWRDFYRDKSVIPFALIEISDQA